MEAPKQDFSCFVNFPADIWAYVVPYLSGEQLGRLKMTGATYLWNKLRLPRVVKSVKLGEDFLNFQSWPAFLNEFPSLDELSIHSYGRKWWSELGLKLHSVPPTVKKLLITGDLENPSNFFVSESGDILRLDTFLPHLEVLDFQSTELTDFAWIAHSPPNLTHLSIFSWDGTVTLPPSLLHFHSRSVELTELNLKLKDEKFNFQLPPNLETLVTNASSRLDVLIPFLPPSFRQLITGMDSSNTLPLDLLPKSLTSLQIPVALDLNFVWSPSQVKLLPATLTELSVYHAFPYSVWPYLPPNLQSLTCPFSYQLHTKISKVIVHPSTGASHSLFYCPFELLPKSLTHLEFTARDGPAYCAPSELKDPYFPPRLTSLVIQDLQLSPDAAKLLPPTLTRLEMETLCEKVAQHLPRGLKLLHAYCTLMSPNLVKCLPRSITELYLTCADDDDSFFVFDHTTGELIESILEFPDYEIHDQYGTNVDWKGALPPALTSLEFHLFQQLGDSFVMNAHLPHLREMLAGSALNISDLSIPFLHPQLTTIDFSESSKITGQCFPFLPRSLTWLYLASSESIFDNDIQHLPRTLIVLSFFSAIKLTDLCIRDFPRRLERLNMLKNKTVTTACIPDLPCLTRSQQPTCFVQFFRWGFSGGQIRMRPSK